MITTINEYKNKSIIDETKLLNLANSIQTICNGEYGNTYWNKDTNSIFICLGDSNPFDDNLDEWIKEIVSDYSNHKDVNVEIDNECMPFGEGWFIFKNNKFIKYS